MGTFMRHPDGHFMIDGERFSEEVFLSIEPGYAMAAPAIGEYYEQGKGHWLTDGENTLPGEFPWVQGDIYISRLSDFLAARDDDEQADTDAEDAAEQATFDAQTPAEQRRLKYPPIHDMIEALWRHVVEGEDLNISGCQAIQDLRDSIRTQYPDV